MATDSRDYLIRQFDIAWMLTSFHLEGLTTEECLWRPASRGLQVHRTPDGGWKAEWPDREGYDIGPPSIAWITWHINFWWSMAQNHSFGDGTLARENVPWPGTADAVRQRLRELEHDWRAAIQRLNDDDLRSPERTRWPFKDRPFGDVIGWATVELTKNVSELGYGRFLYGVRPPDR